MKCTTSIIATATLAVTSAEPTNEERELGWGPPPPHYFASYWGNDSSSKSSKGSSKSSKGSWGSSSKSGKSSGKSGKGSSKSGKGSEEQKYKWVWIPYENDHGWSEESSGKSGKGSSGKSGKGSYGGSSGSGKSGKGSYGSSGGGSGKSGKGSSYSDDGDDWAGDDVWAAGDDWAGDDWAGSTEESSDDKWGGSDDDDHMANGWEPDGHTGYYKPNPDGWAHDGHVPGTYEEYVGEAEDGNGYSEGIYNHVTEFCYASCDGDECTYHMKVDLYASEFGAITFEECEDILFPTITMEIGKTYKFVQSDISNYWHPIGFGYRPDAGPYEIDPANSPPDGDDSCADDSSCPSVDYKLNGQDISLDDYEAQFGHPLGEWVSAGTYSAEFNFPDDTGYSHDLFYWCHVSLYCRSSFA
jgi:hypothetical protein